MKASTEATTQTPASRRPTGTANMAARSLRSAAARTAMPMSVRARTRATAAMARTATTTATNSSVWKTVVPNSSWNDPGMRNVLLGAARSVRPHRRGINRAPTARNWARPMVATVSTSRGDLRKRRTTTRSMASPMTTAATRPMTSPPK